jgi:mono/diheme cytochrome c family protein
MRPKSVFLASVMAAVLVVAGRSAALAQAGGGGDPERGGRLYIENCALCHGVDGRGRAGANLNAFPGIEVDAALIQTISEGVEGSVMPAWATTNGGPLTDQDIRDIAAYIVSSFGGTSPIRPLPTYETEFIPALPGVEGDPSVGSAVYRKECVACHGQEGEGRFGLTLAKSWPGNEPAAFIRQVIRDGIPGTTMPAWGEAKGGPLSDQQVTDVSAYVLSLSPVAAPAPTPVPAEGPIGTSATLIILGVAAVIVIGGLVMYYRRA